MDSRTANCLHSSESQVTSITARGGGFKHSSAPLQPYKTWPYWVLLRECQLHGEGSCPPPIRYTHQTTEHKEPSRRQIVTHFCHNNQRKKDSSCHYQSCEPFCFVFLADTHILAGTQFHSLLMTCGKQNFIQPCTVLTFAAIVFCWKLLKAITPVQYCYWPGNSRTKKKQSPSMLHVFLLSQHAQNARPFAEDSNNMKTERN